MVQGEDARTGAPVVSVADLIARDAPWSGAPDAVDVTGRSGARPRTPAVDLLRRFTVAAWGPNWRFISICACVLIAGLLGNVVLLTTLSSPDHGSEAAGSDEGGYPAGSVGEPPRLTVEPPPATLPAVGLPLALASLGQTVSTGDGRAAVPGLLGAPAGGGSVITGSDPGTSAAGGSVSARTDGGPVGGAVGGVGRTLGNTVGDVGRALPEPLKSPVNGLGKTTKELTGSVGDTLDGLTGGLLGSRDSTGSRDSGSDRAERSERSGSGSGGALGGVRGLLNGGN